MDVPLRSTSFLVRLFFLLRLYTRIVSILRYSSDHFSLYSGGQLYFARILGASMRRGDLGGYIRDLSGVETNIFQANTPIEVRCHKKFTYVGK